MPARATTTPADIAIIGAMALLVVIFALAAMAILDSKTQSKRCRICGATTDTQRQTRCRGACA